MSSNCSLIDSRRHRSIGLRLPLSYALMMAASIGLFLLIRSHGNTLAGVANAEAAIPAAPASSSPDTALPHVLLALTAVLLVGRLVGRLFQWVGQPAIVGEVVVGILLGPSLLGRLVPGASTFLLPASAAPALSAIAQLGVILYMFLVGLEFNPAVLRNRTHTIVAISHASILVPFLLGALLALGLYPRLSPGTVPFTDFALFLGVAMSITAFPVLARILTDRGISRSRLGIMALTCAASDDVTAWCLLAFVIGVARADLRNALVATGLMAGYVGFIFLIVRPLLARLTDRVSRKGFTSDSLAAILVCLLLSALTTEWIGVHALFGAFLFGAVIPSESAMARQLVHKLEGLVTTLLLPAFFALTGMRTQIGLISGPENLLLCGVLIFLATAGKFGGTVAASRLTGLAWPPSLALGAPHEYERTDGADCAEHRPRYEGDPTHAFCDDGADGCGDHLDDRAVAPSAHAEIRGRPHPDIGLRQSPPSSIGPLARPSCGHRHAAATCGHVPAFLTESQVLQGLRMKRFRMRSR